MRRRPSPRPNPPRPWGSLVGLPLWIIRPLVGGTAQAVFAEGVRVGTVSPVTLPVLDRVTDLVARGTHGPKAIRQWNAINKMVDSFAPPQRLDAAINRLVLLTMPLSLMRKQVGSPERALRRSMRRLEGDVRSPRPSPVSAFRRTLAEEAMLSLPEVLYGDAYPPPGRLRPNDPARAYVARAAGAILRSILDAARRSSGALRPHFSRRVIIPGWIPDVPAAW